MNLKKIKDSEETFSVIDITLSGSDVFPVGEQFGYDELVSCCDTVVPKNGSVVVCVSDDGEGYEYLVIDFYNTPEPWSDKLYGSVSLEMTGSDYQSVADRLAAHFGKVADSHEGTVSDSTIETKLKNLRDFVSDFPYYLSESQPYSKGYKDGCFLTREIILNTMDELGL